MFPRWRTTVLHLGNTWKTQIISILLPLRCRLQKQQPMARKLSELDDRADALQAGASQFESSAAKLKNKYWWKNCKMMIIMAIVVYFFY
ncbi:Vesicle-associated membrane protein 1 [Liparis tanakae]|uniref:Vesicle-associated membrane protein 1 n=1 Tax=Liparis tanakae TaxID=230148 RepID=A0A4Z2GZ26_9TELE|nr:Vesicle-associated membrane protein 1 [Liparis tanakae]